MVIALHLGMCVLQDANACQHPIVRWKKRNPQFEATYHMPCADSPASQGTSLFGQATPNVAQICPGLFVSRVQAYLPIELPPDSYPTLATCTAHWSRSVKPEIGKVAMVSKSSTVYRLTKSRGSAASVCNTLTVRSSVQGLLR